MGEKELIYLACPYSHPDEAVRKRRFEKVNVIAARLMREGHVIFSPISHSHPIALQEKLPTDWAFWKAYDEAFLKACKKLIVLKLDGWDQSVGVLAEIDIATKLGIPIEYMDYVTYSYSGDLVQ